MQSKIQYPDHFALEETGYFERGENGRLSLKDRSIGPIIDVHTHLALSYGRRSKIDLLAEHPRTEHYLPMENAIDLEVYANSNFSESNLKSMKRDLVIYGLTKRGMRVTHTAPNLIREMNDLNIARSVILPVDFPWLSPNSDAFLEVAKTTPEIISFGSVHPHDKHAAEKLDRYKEAGAKGIKIHPAVQTVAPDHPKAMVLYRMCAERELPVLWHCGPVDIETRLGRYLTQLKHYWRAVKENPDTTFVLGHAGARQPEQALELAQSHENVWLEIASQGLSVVRRIVKEAPPDRIMFGSDWPFYHQVLPLVKALLATEDCPEIRPKLFWENAARLLDISLEG